MSALEEWSETVKLIINNRISNLQRRFRVFVCKYYHIQTLMRELGIESNSTINFTYEGQDITADEVIQNHAR